MGTSILYTQDSVTFTCIVQMHDNVDTSVTVSLTWVREFHGQPEHLITTSYIFLNESSSVNTAMTEMTIENLTSLDKSVTCKSVVYPFENTFIARSEESVQTVTLDVTGKCQYFEYILCSKNLFQVFF